MSHDTQVTEPSIATATDDRLPVDIRNRIIMHGETAPYHRRVQREHGIDYAELETWTDIRETFSYLDDDSLRDLDPQTFVPTHYSSEELVVSQSSGTTGPVKQIYWHEADVQDNIANITRWLEPLDIPHGVHWVVTTTPNKVLERALRGIASHFNGSVDVIEVDPEPVKRALQSGERSKIVETLEPIASRIRSVFEREDVQVYSDIAPLMKYVGDQLPKKRREQVALLLIGGVGTDQELVEYLTEAVFPNATLSGWYGDYMGGSSMMHEPESLAYLPHTPDVRLEVRNPDRLDKTAAPSERGEIVMHAIRRGFFVPNRRIGDGAHQVEVNGDWGVTNIGRLTNSPQ